MWHVHMTTHGAFACACHVLRYELAKTVILCADGQGGRSTLIHALVSRLEELHWRHEQHLRNVDRVENVARTSEERLSQMRSQVQRFTERDSRRPA